MSEVRAMLRLATQEVHERLHRHPRLAPLKAERLSLGQYRAALTAFHALHRALDRCLGARWPDRPERAPLAAEDLRHLGADPAGLPVLDTLPPLTGTAALLGCRYAAEGSYIGGRSVLDGVCRALGVSDGAGATFLAGSRIDAAGQWKALTACLEHDLVSAEDRAHAVQGAVETFLAFERWLDGRPVVGRETGA
jgi:heme oxygenase